jgi:rhamnosyl/mannosyltransferase
LAPQVVRAPCYGRFLYAPVSPAFPLWLERTLRDFRPDILHFHLPNTSAFWALTSPRARTLPWVIHWHSDVVESTIDRRLRVAYQAYRPFEQAMLKRARSIIVTSPPYREFSPALHAWSPKCHIVPLGLPGLRSAGSSISTAKDWQPGLLRILAIGRLTYYKGFDVLIRAVARIPNAQAIIVGEGDQRNKLQDILADTGAAGRIKLAGALRDSEMQALQDSCEVFCLPSLERTEAFGVVLLEAMQRAKPVLASDIPGSGVGWVVEAGRTGLLSAPGEVEALAANILSVSDPDRRTRLGEAGRTRFGQHFQIDRIAEQLANIYRSTMTNAC